jgi:nucleotide-binding universal stress UspA family protein
MSSPLARILVGYDATPGAQDALRLASVLVRATDGELALACVYHSDRGAAERRLDDAHRLLPYAARPDLLAVQGRSPARSLHATAAAERADLIVVGQPRRERAAVSLVDGVANRLVHGAPCAVAVAPRGTRDQSDLALRVIAVAYDDSKESQHALATAEALALQAGATIRLIGVHDPTARHVGTFPSAYAYVDEFAAGPGALHDALERAADALDPRVRPLVVVERGTPAEKILQRAQVADLLITGSRGHGPLLRAMLGGVSAKLVDEPVCPTLVVPRAVDPPNHAVLPQPVCGLARPPVDELRRRLVLR